MLVPPLPLARVITSLPLMLCHHNIQFNKSEMKSRGSLVKRVTIFSSRRKLKRGNRVQLATPDKTLTNWSRPKGNVIAAGGTPFGGMGKLSSPGIFRDVVPRGELIRQTYETLR